MEITYWMARIGLYLFMGGVCSVTLGFSMIIIATLLEV